MCHGAKGRDSPAFPKQIWGPAHDIAKFGNSKGLFEYVQLLMPFDNPAKLDDAAKTAIVAYMLARQRQPEAERFAASGGNRTAIK